MWHTVTHVNCSSCRAPLRPGSRFCVVCGTAQVVDGTGESLKDAAPQDVTVVRSWPAPPQAPPSSASTRWTRRRGLLVLGLLALLVAGGTAVATAAHGSGGHSRRSLASAPVATTTAASSAPTAPAPASPTTDPSTTAVSSSTTLSPVAIADAFSSLLAQSAADRRQIVAATSQLTQCTDVVGAVASVQAVMVNRRQLIQKLNQQATGTLTDGTQIKSDLAVVLHDSLETDTAYEEMGLSDESDCTPGAPPTAAVDTTNSASTASKTIFAQVWNPVATMFALPTITQATI
jgi:hypothetical protein